MPRALSAPLAVLAIAALVAGCGGGSGGGSSGASSASTAGTSTVVTAGAGLPAGRKRGGDPGSRQEETHEKRPPSKLGSTSANVVMQTTCAPFTIMPAGPRAPRTPARPA